MSISLAIYVADDDQVFESAVARGSKVMEPIANFVSGAMISCPFRHNLMTQKMPSDFTPLGIISIFSANRLGFL